jgi:hypothetical protein
MSARREINVVAGRLHARVLFQRLAEQMRAALC